jgi:hypothetical protein
MSDQSSFFEFDFEDLLELELLCLCDEEDISPVPLDELR